MTIATVQSETEKRCQRRIHWRACLLIYRCTYFLLALFLLWAMTSRRRAPQLYIGQGPYICKSGILFLIQPVDNFVNGICERRDGCVPGRWRIQGVSPALSPTQSEGRTCRPLPGWQIERPKSVVTRRVSRSQKCVGGRLSASDHAEGA